MTSINLNNLNLTELKKLAKEKKKKGYSKLNKFNLIKLISDEYEQNQIYEKPIFLNHIKDNNDDIVRVASIDIGKKNFAIYIEEFNKNDLLSIQNIPKNKRYEISGIPTKEFEVILNSIYKNGKIVLILNEDITINCLNTKKLCNNIFYNLIDLLDKYILYFDNCDTILIEQQMQFGKKRNNSQMTKLSHFCYSYFIINDKYKNKNIIEFPAYYKTQVLGAEKIQTIKNNKIIYKFMDKPTRKKWSIQKTIDILNLRDNSNSSLNWLLSNKKKDDLSDVIIQLQAYKFLKYIDKQF
jgi:hypothetical protein